MRHMAPNVLIMGIFTFCVVFIFNTYYPVTWVLRIGIHSLLGIVLGLILVFRTNTAYDRWWEGRKLWGSLVNISRTLAMKVNSVTGQEDQHDRLFFARIISDFAFSLRSHLRGKVNPDDIEGEVYPELTFEGSPHIPNRIMVLAHKRVSNMLAKNKINGEQYLTMATDLTAMVDVLGACERIKNTPIPISYSMYIKKFIFVYLLTLPFGLKEDFHYWSVPAVMFITYILLGIEMIAEEIEDPFGTDENDLPTDTISSNIRANVHEILKIPLRNPERKLENSDTTIL